MHPHLTIDLIPCSKKHPLACCFLNFPEMIVPGIKLNVVFFLLFGTYTLEKHTNTAMLAIGTESPRRTLVSDTFVAVAFLSTNKKM